MKRHRLRNWLIIGGVVTVCIGILLVSGGVAFAISSTEGFHASLQALLDGLIEYFKFVIELFEAIS